MRAARTKCGRCGKYRACDRHHITYAPDITIRICRGCHKEITFINAIVAVLTNTKRDNITRLKTWIWFIEQKRAITINMVVEAFGSGRELTSREKKYVANAKKRLKYKGGK